MANTGDRIFVTYVDSFNDLLKIWGQPDRTCATYVEKQLTQLGPEFDKASGPSPNSVRKGMLCFAKCADEHYYRAKVISDVFNNFVMVLFIDYGNKERVSLSNIRVRNGSAESVVTKIVPQAEEFYLAYVGSHGGWSPEIVHEVRRELCNSEYNYRTVYKSEKDHLIQINYSNEDYASYLIGQKQARHVSVKDQIIMLKNAMKNQQIGMEQIGNLHNSKSASYQAPAASNRSDGRFMHNKTQVLQNIQYERAKTQAQAAQVNHAPAQNVNANANVNANSERQFAVNSSQNPVYNQNNNSDPNSTPVINSVVIEALANQIKQHLLRDPVMKTVPETTSHNYFTQVLDVGSTHNVYVSFVDDGPWSFSVQLVSSEHELNQLMGDLACTKLVPIKCPLVLGYPCIAKSKQYGNNCRGVVVNIAHSAVRIFFVDFGNTEDLPLSSLFELPVHFFKVKAMSQKFALSGLQRVKPSEEIKRAFVDVVENELLLLQVTTLEGENLPTCDLYLKNTNIKRILNEKVRKVCKWDALQLPPGYVESVVVTWVDSPQKFFVQLKSNMKDLLKLKAELSEWGISGEHFQADEMIPGAMCICCFTGDNNWYRAVILSVNSKTSVTVFYVDYGNTEVVSTDKIKKVGHGLIRQLSTQAIHCGLQEFENRQYDPNINSVLQNLILEKELVLTVISVDKDRVIVKLFDKGTDISAVLTQPKINVKPGSNASGVKEETEKSSLERDGSNKNERRNSNYPVSQAGSEECSKSRGRKEDKSSRGEKPNNENLSWRFEDNRKDHGGNKTGRTRERNRNEFSSDGNRSERGDARKNSRYSFKSNKTEDAAAPSRKDHFGNNRGTEKNWRSSNDRDRKNFGGDERHGNKPVSGIGERMRKAARENETRGLAINPTGSTKYPVKLENIALHGSLYKEKIVEVGSVEDVIVTYFTSPSEIYIQLISSKEEFRLLMDKIQNYYISKLPVANAPKKGDIVIAKFKLDEVLYRAIVIETNPLTVRYIDFGNEEVTDKEKLWPMDKCFLDLEAQSIRCSLPNLKPSGSDSWPVPDEQIDKIFVHEKYSCTFLKNFGGGYEVNLIISDSGKDVRDELISSGFAAATPVKDRPVKISDIMDFNLMTNEVFNVFVTHVVDAHEFFVQIDSCKMNNIKEDISEAVERLEYCELNGFESDENLFLALDGGNWHRAKLVRNTNVETTVELIDYGVRVNVNKYQVRKIPDNVAAFPPQAVRCCIFHENTEFSDKITDELKACCEKNFAAFIHEVADKRLTVTLYDTNGDKLRFLDGLSDAPVHISPISTLPIINQGILVNPSHFLSPKEIYIQLGRDLSDLNELSSSMIGAYDKGGEELEVEVGEPCPEMCAAKSAVDECWYRARILSVTERGAKVFYIDFGDAEEVPFEHIKKLDPSFYEHYAYARKVSLNLDYEERFEREINQKLLGLIKEEECIGYFVKMNDVLYADLFVNGSNVTDELISEHVQRSVKDMFKDFKPKEEEDIDGIKVFISHVSSPKEFWVHKESISSDIESFQERLQATSSFASSKNDVKVGDMVGALFTDQLWYRALVTDVNDNTISVRFVDYGNNLDIDAVRGRFIVLEEDLKKVKPFAFKCSLNGEWKENAALRFEEIVMNQVDTLTLVKLEGEKVDLLQNGESITEQLLNEGYGLDGKEMVYVTHINSPDDFYVQKVSDQRLIQDMIDKLYDADSFEDELNVEVGRLGCAQSSGDGLWYRAKILGVRDEDVTVQFIDYGDCSSVKAVKVLDPSLESLPPLSTNCGLINGRNEWSEEASAKFMTHLDNTLFRMEIVREDVEKTYVRLYVKKNDAKTGGHVGDDAEELDLEGGKETGGRNFPLNAGAIVSGDIVQDDPPIEEKSGPEENLVKENGSESLDEKFTSGLVGGGWEVKKAEDDETGVTKKVSHSEKIVPNSIARGASLEGLPISSGAPSGITSLSSSAYGTQTAFGREKHLEINNRE